MDASVVGIKSPSSAHFLHASFSPLHTLLSHFVPLFCTSCHFSCPPTSYPYSAHLVIFSLPPASYPHHAHLPILSSFLPSPPLYPHLARLVTFTPPLHTVPCSSPNAHLVSAPSTSSRFRRLCSQGMADLSPSHASAGAYGTIQLVCHHRRYLLRVLPVASPWYDGRAHRAHSVSCCLRGQISWCAFHQN